MKTDFYILFLILIVILFMRIELSRPVHNNKKINGCNLTVNHIHHCVLINIPEKEKKMSDIDQY